MKIKAGLISLSIFFVFLSFFPSLFEMWEAKKLPSDRTFVLEHNYMFDYNFYLSRIRQGQPARQALQGEAGGEGRWTVIEKYYNQPHNGSFFQILYLLLGKIGAIVHLPPPVVYHLARILLGFLFLLTIASYTQKLFPGKWSIVAFLLIVTASSWPIPIIFHDFPRFATYMGWWSVIDSLARITFIPHILLGQLFILLFLWRFSGDFHRKSWMNLFLWGMTGLIVGIIFPPTLFVVYIGLVIITLLEIVEGVYVYREKYLKSFQFQKSLFTRIIPRIIFIALSVPVFIYLQKMFQIPPWSALALFDIEHRFIMPYREYALALGPILPPGLLGGILALKNNETKLFPAISWVVSIFLLFWIFEGVPTQSPLRFTEGAIHIPLGILTIYFFLRILSRLRNLRFLREKTRKVLRLGVFGLIGVIILMGLGVMFSMIGWLTDQSTWKREATFVVPVGAQIGYPLKDFMDAVYFLRDNTPNDSVVLSYITAGNFIPAYAGNFVYIGHANTPKEDAKEKIAQDFFSGRMKEQDAKEFLQKERISYIYYGPQEREWGKGGELVELYPFVQEVYRNSRVVIYKIGKEKI